MRVEFVLSIVITFVILFYYFDENIGKSWTLICLDLSIKRAIDRRRTSETS